MFGDHEASDEDEEVSSKNTSESERHRDPPKGPGLVLPSFPVGGFKLRSTGKNLYDESASKDSDSPPQEIRASFPLSHKEETRNIVVENLLEKQLSKADIKVSSLPTTALDRMDRETQEPVDEEDSECFSGSTNSLDEIEEATRRVREPYFQKMDSVKRFTSLLPPYSDHVMIHLKGYDNYYCSVCTHPELSIACDKLHNFNLHNESLCDLNWVAIRIYKHFSQICPFPEAQSYQMHPEMS